MLTTIKTTHDGCGNSDLTPADIRLKTFAPSDCRDFYEFICALCGALVQKSADDTVINMLRSGGVAETRIFLPVEALDPMRGLTQPMTWDELLDFQLELRLFESLPIEPEVL